MSSAAAGRFRPMRCSMPLTASVTGAADPCWATAGSARNGVISSTAINRLMIWSPSAYEWVLQRVEQIPDLPGIVHGQFVGTGTGLLETGELDCIDQGHDRIGKGRPKRVDDLIRLRHGKRLELVIHRP